MGGEWRGLKSLAKQGRSMQSPKWACSPIDKIQYLQTGQMGTPEDRDVHTSSENWYHIFPKDYNVQNENKEFKILILFL